LENRHESSSTGAGSNSSGSGAEAQVQSVATPADRLEQAVPESKTRSKNPILKPLDQISCRDAILNLNGTEAKWPPANCIIGNPPFLGDRDHRNVPGENYTLRLRTA